MLPWGDGVGVESRHHPVLAVQKAPGSADQKERLACVSVHACECVCACVGMCAHVRAHAGMGVRYRARAHVFVGKRRIWTFS